MRVIEEKYGRQNDRKSISLYGGGVKSKKAARKLNEMKWRIILSTQHRNVVHDNNEALQCDLVSLFVVVKFVSQPGREIFQPPSLLMLSCRAAYSTCAGSTQK